METEREKLPINEKILAKMLVTIQKYHAGQFRSNKGIPYWVHCQGVTQVLEDVLAETNEIDDPDLLTDLMVASLGHDLLEDTKISATEIEQQFGVRAANFIQFMTNYEGDMNRQAYVEKIKHAPEEIKLIKLSDMVENCTSVADSAKELGRDWIAGFFLPIISEMKAVIRIEDFTKYKETASRLIAMVDSAYKRAYNALEQLHPKTQITMSTESIGTPDEDTILEAALRQNNERKEQQKIRIAEAKKTAGKEPLDIEKLRKIYNFASGNLSGEEIITPDVIHDIEVIYYLKQPELMSLEALAEQLHYLDAYDSN